MNYDDNDFFKNLNNKYYYLGLSEMDFRNIFSNSIFNSCDEMDDYVWKLIKLVLNNNSDGLIEIDRNKMLSNFIDCQLVYSDDLDDNLTQLKMLYPFYDMIIDKQDIININCELINSNQVLMHILKNMFKYYPQLDYKDSYLMFLMDSYSNVIINDFFESGTGEIGDSFSLYKNSIRNLPKVTDEERYELLIKAKNGNAVARKRFIESNLKLVFAVAKNYSNYGDISDLIQSGNVGLIEAYDKFDINKGSKFSTCAFYWIRREIIVFLNNNHPLKIPRGVYFMIRNIKQVETKLINLNLPVSSEIISRETGIKLYKVEYLRSVPLVIDSIDAPISDESDSSSIEEFISSEVDIESDVFSKMYYEQVYDIVKLMVKDGFIEKRDSDILLMRTGFFKGKVYTFDEIGKQYKISRQRVEQIYKNTLRKIRRSKYRFNFAAYLDDEKEKNKIFNRKII